MAGLKIDLAVAGSIGQTVAGLSYLARMGNGAAPSGKITVLDGTGAGLANQFFFTPFSIPTVTRQSYDLKGGGGELDVLNRALNMAKLKYLYLELDAPAAGNSIQFGPAAVTNAAQLWFQAATVNFYDVVRSKMLMEDFTTGWAIGASTKVISLYNPGATTVAGKLFAVGNL